MQELRPAEIDGFLSEAIKNYGRDAVKRIVLRMSPEAVAEYVHVLLKRGFDRCTAFEGGDAPEIVYVGPANRWE